MSVLKFLIVLDSLNDRTMMFNCLTFFNKRDWLSVEMTDVLELLYASKNRNDNAILYMYICIVNCCIHKQTVSLRDWWGTTISFHILLRIPEFCELGQDFISIKPGPSGRCVVCLHSTRYIRHVVVVSVSFGFICGQCGAVVVWPLHVLIQSWWSSNN